MIPKIIHYCWFGGKKLPREVRAYISNWKKICPDYDIREWNESNFPINQYPYAKEALEARKYAFVSDVARLYALKEQGGIYLDTDVELLKSFDSFLHHKSFVGLERKEWISTAVIGSEKDSAFVNQCLESYVGVHFCLVDGKMDTTPNTHRLTKVLKKYGFEEVSNLQTLENGLFIYPQEYFSPLTWFDKTNCQNDNTVAIHHFESSWLPFAMRLKFKHPNWYKIYELFYIKPRSIFILIKRDLSLKF